MRRLGYTLLFFALIGAIDALGQVTPPKVEPVAVLSSGVWCAVDALGQVAPPKVELTGSAPAPPPALSDVQTLKAQSYQYRASTIATRYEGEKTQALAAISKKFEKEVQALEAEKIALEADFHNTLQCDKGQPFDWPSLACKSNKPQPKESKK